MSRTIAAKQPKTRPPEASPTELPPVEDWRVHFNDPGAAAPKVPWDVERVESSGMIFLKAVADRVREDQEREAKALEPELAVVPTGILAPLEETHRSRVPWVVGGVLALLLAGAGLFAGFQLSHRSPAAAVADVQPSAAMGAVMAAAPVVVADAVEKKAAPSLAPAPEPPSAPAVVAPAAAPDEERTAVAPKERTRKRARRDRRSKRRETARERLERKRAEAKELQEDNENAAAKALPSIYDSLKAVKPVAAPRAAAPRPQPRVAVPVDDKLKMLVRATARNEMRRVNASSLPTKLSARVLRRHARSVQGKARSCLNRFGIAGETVRLHIVVKGSTGRVASSRIHGSRAGTPAARCIERAARKLTFPRFQTAQQGLTVPISVR